MVRVLLDSLSRILSIAGYRVSQDVVDSISELLIEAKRGQIPGLIYIALHNGSYSADVLGTAKDARIYSIGLLRKLEHRLLED